ncbi:helix-turn-helix domain-containing protein [Enterococcus cecorum]|uniref:helix-turn-helix domain-containing protein n=1 Tax=Enterococcus cecorum TaxID=44008 RepID=UPI003F1ECEBB
MIDGEKIKQARKRKKMSQKDLAEGITTQATISLLERNNIEPSGTVLGLILNKLDLQLNDVLVNADTNVNISNKLRQAEICCMKYEYYDAKQLLNEIKDFVTEDFKTRYLFLETNTKMWLDSDFDSAVFGYNIIIQQNKNDIYTALAMCELGVVYAKKDMNDNALYYFRKVEELLNELSLERTPFWSLFIYDNISKFYSNILDHNKCLSILKNAENFAQELNAVFFLDQIYFLFATTIRDVNGGWNEEAIHYLLQSYVFAKYFNNRTVLTKSSQYLKENLQLIHFD